jgi:hypothetical protein
VAWAIGNGLDGGARDGRRSWRLRGNGRRYILSGPPRTRRRPPLRRGSRTPGSGFLGRTSPGVSSRRPRSERPRSCSSPRGLPEGVLRPGVSFHRSPSRAALSHPTLPARMSPTAAFSPIRSVRSRRAREYLRWVLRGSERTQNNARKQPISDGDAHGCWTGAMRISENIHKAKCNFA